MCAQAAAQHRQGGLCRTVPVRPVLHHGALKGEIVAALVSILVVSNNEKITPSLCVSKAASKRASAGVA
jgi:hypothetical protein